VNKEPSTSPLSTDHSIPHIPLSVLGEFVAELAATSRQADIRSPLLYHYSSAAAVAGILESRQVWSTHFEYLNDVSEAHLLPGLAIEEAGRRLEAPELDQLDRLILSRVVERLHETAVGDPFVFSLTEDGDSLEQWRAYGSDGRGLAVGFRLLDLDECLLALGPRTLLWRVLYEPDEWRKLVEAIFDNLLRIFREHWTASGEADGIDSLAHSGYIAIAHTVNLVAPIAKHPAFGAEREWRMVTTGPDIRWLTQPPGALSPPADKMDEMFRSIEYRPAGDQITLFTKVPLAAEAEVPPVAEVVVGPCADGDQTFAALHLLLQRNGYPRSIEVRRSDIPYRSSQ
jgi:hypothetical protein